MTTFHRITFHGTSLMAAALLLMAYGVYAQQTSQEKTGTVSISVQGSSHPAQTTIVRLAAPSPRETVVTGAPYSAEVVSESEQTLADGTHITHKSQSTNNYRDSEGRTRRETSPGGAQIVEIRDPVSGFGYVLDVQNRVAHRFAPSPEATNGVATYTQTARAGSSAVSSGPSGNVTPAQAPPDRPQISTESLGTQVVEGILAEGTKTTRTIPIGMMGNDRPLVNVMETWFSRELRITVLHKSSDPRMGEQTMRLQNIDRTEPDPALFRVPPDYQIVDESGDQVEIKITRP